MRSQKKTANKSSSSGGGSAESCLVLLAILLIVESVPVLNLNMKMFMAKRGDNVWSSYDTVQRGKQKGILL